MPDIVVEQTSKEFSAGIDPVLAAFTNELPHCPINGVAGASGGASLHY
jgi:hypothetical protein